jgi:hypothetical protein
LSTNGGLKKLVKRPVFDYRSDSLHCSSVTWCGVFWLAQLHTFFFIFDGMHIPPDRNETQTLLAVALLPILKESHRSLSQIVLNKIGMFQGFAQARFLEAKLKITILQSSEKMMSRKESKDRLTA